MPVHGPGGAASATAGPPNRRRLAVRLIAIGALVLAAFFAYVPVKRAFTTVSTDDAYVNGHVTFVAPRVAGQVARCWWMTTTMCTRAILLVQLDREPFQVQVNIAEAAVVAAQADLIVADDQTRSLKGRHAAAV